LFLFFEKGCAGAVEVSVKSGIGAVEVYFDDFKVEHTKSPVIQTDEYYPFGLTFNSYQRESSVLNRIKFQSQEHIDDLNLGWDSFKWRNHQPDIGRFFNVDPLSEKYVYNSVYAFSENKVTSHRELEGLEAEPVNDPLFDSPMAEEPADEGPSLNSVLEAGANAWNTITGFLFGDGNDGTPESASRFGSAMESVPAIGAEGQKIKSQVEEIVAPIPGLNSAFNVMDAGQAKTTGETLNHLGKAAVNANSIPIAGGPGSGKAVNKLKPDPLATGNHTTFKTNNMGKVYKYETYKQTNSGHFNPVKRFDGGKPDGSAGAAHVNKKTKQAIPTPHVQGKDIPGGVRPASPYEIPQ
jgi:RHS repeat-associated protein